MRDRLTKERRRWNMSRNRGKDTAPEKVVRSILHRMGYRFRLHGKKLPSRPDIVLPKYKTVVFVHGCFWHRRRGLQLQPDLANGDQSRTFPSLPSVYLAL